MENVFGVTYFSLKESKGQITNLRESSTCSCLDKNGIGRRFVETDCFLKCDKSQWGQSITLRKVDRSKGI